MENQDKQVYKWLVKRGSILLFENGDKVHLELDDENSDSCLLTKEDAEEVITIMTSLCKNIWSRQDYVAEPYNGKHYKTDENNGIVYWEIGFTKLYVSFNLDEEAIEIKYSGNAVIPVSVNYGVEIIQIMTHYYKQF